MRSARLSGHPARLRDAADHDLTNVKGPGPLLAQGPGPVTSSPLEPSTGHEGGPTRLPPEEVGTMLPTGTTETPAIDRTACPADRHGTASAAKNRGCECRDALAARRWQEYRRKTGRGSNPFVDATGTRRRIQGLKAAGWRYQDIADLTGTSTDWVFELSRDDVRPGRARRRTRASTATTIRRAFDQLSSRPEPAGAEHDRMRSKAAAWGWVRACEWNDIDDPDELPDSAYRRDPAAVVATDDLLELAAEYTTLDDHGRTVPDTARIAAHVGLDEREVGHRLQFARTGKPATPPDVVDAVRADYRAAKPGEFVRTECAARHGTNVDAVDRALRGSSRDGYPDLVAELGRKHRNATGAEGRDRPLHPPVPVDDATVDAIRADYAAGGIGTHRLAERYGTTQSTVLRIVNGTARPQLGLSDLTAARGEHISRTPTGGTNRKDDAA